MARGIRPFIVWGSAFPQERLIFGWPLDDAIAYSLPRNGSEFIVLPSGVTDAWLTGHDSILAARVRSIPRVDELLPRPATGWEGAAGWDAFLRWAREGGAFTLYPDGRNHVLSPEMDTDTDANGVVNDFLSSTGGTAGMTATFTRDGTDGAQQIGLTGTGDATSFAQVYQDLYGRFVEGMSLVISADVRHVSLVNAVANLRVQGLDASGVMITQSAASANAGASYGRVSVAYTVPANTRRVRAIFRVTSNNTSAKSGSARCRDMMLEVGTTASASYVGQPGGVSCFLRSPLDAPAGTLEKQINYRALDLELRAVDGTSFTGF
ncbi:MAG TPA: hypothetical protein PK788_13035 [Gemmatimonadaceae bacterium]|nr:hypothetical protein [Gemmatimonadaceae bacterium]